LAATQQLESPFRNLPHLSVVIVNWNAGRLVKDCLRSVYALTEEATLEVFVVDNASRKGDLDDVMQAFPQANYIFLNENLGFSRANNVAIRRARGEYIALLNPDTYLRNSAFDLMLAHLGNHPEVGAIGPKLATPDGGIQYDAGRNLPTLTTEFAHNFFLHHLIPQTRLGGSDYIRWWNHEDTRQVGALCGACMVVRREVIDKVGLLDENFFLYWEDVEWCYRIQRAGCKLTYLPQAEVFHLGGHSMAQNPVNSLHAAFQSSVLFFHKHHGAQAANVARALILCGCILRILLWLAILPLPKHRREAKDRLGCYGKTIAWILGGHSAVRPQSLPIDEKAA
jgi:GT2 family glycosyltransferase